MIRDGGGERRVLPQVPCYGTWEELLNIEQQKVNVIGKLDGYCWAILIDAGRGKK